MEAHPPTHAAEQLAAQLEEVTERTDVLTDTVRSLVFAVRQACQLASTAELTDKQGMLLDVYLQQAQDAENMLPSDEVPEAEETTDQQRASYTELHTSRRSRREADKLARMGGVDQDWTA